MKHLKVVLTAIIVMAAAIQVRAQSASSLIGKWQTSYDWEEAKVTLQFEFKKQEGQLICLTLYIKDEEGNGEAYESVVMKDIRLKDGKGTARYLLTYEGESYELDAKREPISPNTLRVSYSQDGYSDTETWRRIN